MRNLVIHFSQPWLLLLLIPAIAFTLLPYFLLKKKYRKTRNRIISMILHGIVMTLAILVLSGITFSFQIPNYENEIILLVDVSDTERESTDEGTAKSMEEFILTVLDEAQYDGYKIGIVTFGFDQVYAVPLTHDLNSVYDLYESAPLPDTSATDIAAALRYTRTLFSKPETAKIVLLSDGKETDEKAMEVIRSVAAQGTKVDTVYFSSEFGHDNVQVVGVEYPEYHVKRNEVCTLEISVHAREAAEEATIEIFDNGTFDSENGSQTLPLAQGTQVVEFSAIFETEGLHEIVVKVTEASDGLVGNNTYYSYYYLEVYDQVLIIDQGVNDGESDALEAILKGGEEPFHVEQLHLMTDDNIPNTVDALRNYDQIILNNIANGDLPEGFDHLLYSYVYDFGGGLFTTGGSNEDATPHAYNRDDLRLTLLQDMLPVQAINYTPPVGVIIIIDVSGSMSGEKLDWAKNGAVTCLDALTSRDYVGIMTLSNDYGTVLQLTRRTEETRIKEAINSVEIQGATHFTGAIDRAARMLNGESRIDRRHMIIVTDGAPTESAENYLPLAAQYYRESGITISVVGIDLTEGSDAGQRMEELVDKNHGNGHVYYASSEQQIILGLQRDLNASEIKDYNPEPFYPVVSNVLSPVINGVNYVTDSGSKRYLEVSLDGFYGVHARDSADVVLAGEFEVPIYAQWKYGKGMVGSFMCDVSGEWSSEFLADEGGQRILRNIVSTLMPTQNIRPNEITLKLRGENYINEMSVLTSLEHGEYIKGTITYTEDGEEFVVSLNELPETTEGLSCYTTLAMGPENRYTRANFVIKRGGTYHIVVNKYDADGNLLATVEQYKSFAYSKEYDMFSEESDIAAEAFLSKIAERGNGIKVDSTDPWSIFNDFVTAVNRLYDPRLPFIIIAIVLFLLDIAVRKFKFKWPHELIREYKQRRGYKE